MYRKAGKTAFSLTELLVGIAVIAILSSLTLAIASRIRESSLNTQCLSHLRQVGIALFQFAADHNRRIPGRAYKGPNDQTAEVWHRVLVNKGYITATARPHLGTGALSSPVLYCPSFYPYGPTTSIHAHMRFGMRVWAPPGQIKDDTQLLPLSAIDEPANFFLVADSYYSVMGSQGYQIVNGAPEWAIHTRHRQHANTLFADGHVEPKNVSYFEAITVPQAKYSAGAGLRPFYIKK